MKNTHLEHPEDAILNFGKDGAKSVLKFLKQKNSTFSLKWDGSPAIVWGKDPETKTFFIGTKAVFNKVKLRIAHSHEEIDQFYSGEVAKILHHAFDCLPRVDYIVQGDFIGLGENDEYCPNTIKYKFSNLIKQKIIVAAHTVYHGDTLKSCEVISDQSLYWRLVYNDVDRKCKFLSCYANSFTNFRRIDMLCSIANMVIPFIRFPDEKRGKEIKQYINTKIRQGEKISIRKISKETKESLYLFILYKLIIKMKNILINTMVVCENVSCYVNEKPSSHEGYVMVNKYGMYKLVDRLKFSYANFNSQKDWKNK